MSYSLGIIPARSGSKGVVDKNIKILAGFPLLAYSVKAAINSNNVDRVIVSTDSEEYAEIARKHGAEVPFLRPKNISGDSSPDYLFVKHILDWLNEKENCLPSHVIHLRPTTPLREIKYIDDAIRTFYKCEKATALRSVHEMPESAYKTFEIENGILKCLGTGSTDLDGANEARQVFPATFSGNGYVDVLNTEFILKNHCLHGNNVIGYITPLITEFDTMEDFKLLEYELLQNSKIREELFAVE